MKMLTKPNRLSLAIGVALCAAVAMPGVVQAKEEKAARMLIDEVIVTATRREASMQSIPMSINAFDRNRLEESGIEDIRDLSSLAAGVYINNEGGNLKISMRGIATTQLTLGAEEGVALHRDGVFIASRFDRSMSFFDVERIEVLRGPQGTLYGRNATGGAINIITGSPTEDFEAAGTVGFGNYDLVETEGYVSGPLAGEELAARVAFKTRRNSGYTPNVFNGEDYDNDDFAAVRAKLRYQPSSDLTFQVSADFARDDGVPATVNARGRTGNPLPGESAGLLPSGRAVILNNDNINSRESWGVDGRVDWFINDFKLSSITAYRELDWRLAFDLDASAASLLFTEKENRSSKQFSQEITLTSPDSGRLQWVLGGYFLHADDSDSVRVLIPPFDAVFAAEIPELEGDAYAVFAESNYQLSDSFTLTLGARYSYEEKSITQTSGGGSESLSDDWSSFTPKVALTYTASNNVTVYSTISRGFKAGSFNGRTLQGTSFDPEKVTNYEVGVKGAFYDDRIWANVSAFYMDYTDQQVPVRRQNPINNLTLTLIDNAASATIKGVELETLIQPTERFSLDANISWLDATFDEWPDAIDVARGGAEFDVAGNRLINAPEWTVNLGANYEMPVSNWGTAALRLEYSHRSEIFTTPFDDDFRKIESVDTIDARLAFRDSADRWKIAGYVRNITDELVPVHRDEIFSGLTGNRIASLYQPPRTYGIEISYKF